MKDLEDQIDKVDKADLTEKEGDDGDKTDQELPPWTKVTKSRFNEIKGVITKANKNKLESSIKKRKITLKNAEELLEVLISRKIGRKRATKMYNSVADDANKSGNLKKQSLEKK